MHLPDVLRRGGDFSDPGFEALAVCCTLSRVLKLLGSEGSRIPSALDLVPIRLDLSVLQLMKLLRVDVSCDSITNCFVGVTKAVVDVGEKLWWVHVLLMITGSLIVRFRAVEHGDVRLVSVFP
jgi:hypothetical protein